MSFDLFFWDSPRPVGREEADALYQTAGEDEQTDPQPLSRSLRQFLEEMLKTYPPLESLEGESLERSPWSVTPEGTGRGVTVYISWSSAKQVGPHLSLSPRSTAFFVMIRRKSRCTFLPE
jgi:hypothetical protein